MRYEIARLLNHFVAWCYAKPVAEGHDTASWSMASEIGKLTMCPLVVSLAP
jgi:hypothetical protein